MLSVSQLLCPICLCLEHGLEVVVVTLVVKCDLLQEIHHGVSKAIMRIDSVRGVEQHR